MNNDEFERKVLREAIVEAFHESKDKLEDELYKERVKERLIMVTLGVITPLGMVVGTVVYDQDLVRFIELHYCYKDKDTIIDLTEKQWDIEDLN